MKRPRLAHVRLLLPFVIVAWRATQPIGDNSFLWHVRAGTAQLDTGSVLRADPFSFTSAGEGWRTQSWLAELGYGWLENLTGGLGWVPLMKLLAISIVVALLGLVIHKTSGGRQALVVGGMLFLVWQSIPYTTARPALLGVVLLATVVAITHTDRRPLWILPPLFWLWASVHGMFVIGLGYLFLDGLRRRSRKQILTVVVSGLATALTAHGLGTWWILLQFARSQGALDLISEWGAPDFSSLFTLPFLLVIVAVIVAGTRGHLQPEHLWVLIPFLTFGLLADRNVWPAVIVLSPLAVRAWSSATSRADRLREGAVMNWAFVIALIALAVLGMTRPAGLDQERFPSAAAVATLRPGPVFTGSVVGGYLIYAEWPQRSVFIDDRAELYGEVAFRRFVDLQAGRGVEEIFGDLEIDQALVAEGWPIVDTLRLLGWENRYQDESFVVLGRP